MGKKPNTLVAGLTRGTVKWDDGRNIKTPAASPWGSAPNGPSGGASDQTAVDSMAEAVGDAAGVPGSNAAGKKGKKGKQVLYKFG